MDLLCASNDSRFVRKAAVNPLRIASGAPCRATHAQQQSTTQLFRKEGRRIDVGCVALEPCVHFASVRMHDDAFAEHSRPAAPDREGGRIHARFATPSLRASLQIDRATRLHIMRGCRHASYEATPTSMQESGGGSAFALGGAVLGKPLGVVQVGVGGRLQPNPKRGTSYADQYRNELQDHGFKFTLNWAFRGSSL